MRIHNRIINYFSAYGEDGKPKLFQSLVTINATQAEEILRKQGIWVRPGMLHVCYDCESQRLYLPNAHQIPQASRHVLMDTLKIYLIRKNIPFSSIPPIEGSPFSSVRIRSVNSFHYVQQVLDGLSNCDCSLPVIEANLARMPTTSKRIKGSENANFMGGYVDYEVDFVDEMDNRGNRREHALFLFKQSTPFILLNISPSVNISLSDKEWVVLSGCRTHLEKSDVSLQGVDQFADLYAIKRFLHLGWAWEEICHIFTESVDDFGKFIKASSLLLESKQDMKIACPTYWASLPINHQKFPLRWKHVLKNIQMREINFIDYDHHNEQLLIEMPVFVSSEILGKIFATKNAPFLCRFDATNKTLHVKSSHTSFERVQRLPHGRMIQKLAQEYHELEDLPEFESSVRSRMVSLSTSDLFRIRKVSDYPYACDLIYRMCQERGIPFQDFQVVLGPLERLFGRGTQGGFMGVKQFKNSELDIPYELVKDVFVEPPLISINSASMPSYAEQTSTLIHEYSHYLFGLSHPEYEHAYAQIKKDNSKEWWATYLNDPDEQLAHVVQIVFELLSGLSVDEIIRDKVGGQVTVQNYETAMLYRQLVDEALQKTEKHYENVIGTN